jgi:hypothetical protein
LPEFQAKIENNLNFGKPRLTTNDWIEGYFLFHQREQLLCADFNTEVIDDPFPGFFPE